MQIFSSAKAINLTHVDMIQYFNMRGDKMLLRKSIQNPDFYHRVRDSKDYDGYRHLFLSYIFYIYNYESHTVFVFEKVF